MQRTWVRVAVVVAGIAMIGYGVDMMGLEYRQGREREVRNEAMRQRNEQLQLQIDELQARVNQLRTASAPK